MTLSRASILLYLASLFLPAVEMPDSIGDYMQTWPGIYCLIAGWVHILQVGGLSVWLANPLYLAGSGLLAARYVWLATPLLWGAALVSLFTFTLVEDFVLKTQTGFALRGGAYFWMAAMLLQAVAAGRNQEIHDEEQLPDLG